MIVEYSELGSVRYGYHLPVFYQEPNFCFKAIPSPKTSEADFAPLHGDMGLSQAARLSTIFFLQHSDTSPVVEVATSAFMTPSAVSIYS